MRLNELPSSKRRRRARLGRGPGCGSGKTCGRGHKGQKSRSGGGVPPGFEGGQMPLQRRLPKIGFNSYLSRISADLRLDRIDALDIDVITVQALREAKLIPGKIRRVKLVNSGEIRRAVTIRGIAVTAGARASIEAAGGKIEAAAEAEG